MGFNLRYGQLIKEPCLCNEAPLELLDIEAVVKIPMFVTY